MVYQHTVLHALEFVIGNKLQYGNIRFIWPYNLVTHEYLKLHSTGTQAESCSSEAAVGSMNHTRAYVWSFKFNWKNQDSIFSPQNKVEP